MLPELNKLDGFDFSGLLKLMYLLLSEPEVLIVKQEFLILLLFLLLTLYLIHLPLHLLRLKLQVLITHPPIITPLQILIVHVILVEVLLLRDHI